MRTRQLTVTFFAITAIALGACNVDLPPIALDDVPIYPAAQRIDPSQHPTAAAMDRQTKQANANGHKSEMRAFLLPKGTTAAQLKEFYVTKLSKFGGQVVIMLPDDGIFGSIELQHGRQALSIQYDVTVQSQPPLLIIDSFIPNGNR